MSEKTLVSLDYAIKFLLKSKGDYEIVEGFISAILQDAGYPAVKITSLLDSESNKESEDLKKSIADVIVEDQQGHNYIVEIDSSYTSYFLHKACFNSCRLIVDSIRVNHDYTTIKKIFHINLIYFPYAKMKSPLYHGKTFFKELERDHSMQVQLTYKDGEVVDINNVFPEYFVISVPIFDDIIRNEMDEWLYFAKHSEVKDDFKSPYMKKVAERLNLLKMTSQERKAYSSYVNESLKQRDYLVSAEEKGIEKGEEKKAIAMAKEMLVDNEPIEKIVKYTKLTLEEIETLKEEVETLKEE
jgi:predicted transposase/invertase (TIGR01784 family)